MIQSIIFLLSWIGAIAALLCLTRTKTKLVWLPVVLVGGAAATFACVSILSALGLGYSLVENTVLNILLVVLSLLAAGRKKGVPPTSFARKGDLVAFAVVMLVAIGCAYLQFGFPFGINFATSDPANHLYSSLQIANGGDVNGQFFTHLICACAIMTLQPLFDSTSVYAVFIVVEVSMLWLAGYSFYAMLAFRDFGRTTVAVILAVIFMLGYPLNNLVFGFSYLGAAVTVVSLCIAVAPMVLGESKNIMGLMLLSLLLYALMITYTLFVPVVYLSLFFSLLVSKRKNGAPFGRIALDEIKLFAFPVLMGFFLSYVPMFTSGTPGDAIAVEGYILRDLYSSFIFIAPLFIYGMYVSLKKRVPTFDLVLVVCTLLFAAALLIGGIAGKVSSYYFFKCHYLLWMLLFLYTAIGVEEALSKSPGFLCSYAFVYLLVFAAWFTGADQRLSTSRTLFNPSPASSTLVPYVYRFNLGQMQQEPISEDIIDLMMRAKSLGDEGGKVAILADDSLTYWFRAITLQEQDGYWWQTSLGEQAERLNDSDYVLVLGYSGALTTASGEDYSAIYEYACGLGEVCYGNGYGSIVKVK